MIVRVAFCERKDDQKKCSGRKARSGMNAIGSVISLVALSLMTAQAAFPASPNVGDILRKVGTVYSHLQDYHIVAIRDDSLVQQRMGYPQRSVITLDAEGPRVRMDLTGEGPNVLIVSDGKTTWHYARRKNEYTEREAAVLLGEPATVEQSDLLGQTQSLLVGRFAKLWQLERDAKFKGEAMVGFQGRKTPCDRIVFHMKDLTDQIWVDRTSFLVLRESVIQTMSSAGFWSRMTENVRITEFRTHATHPRGFFTFTPPSGAQRVASLNIPGIREGFAGARAGNFTLSDIEGKDVSLRDFRGKTVLLSFWATWCLACNAELPTIQKIYEQDKNVVVLAVDGESRTTVAKFLSDKHYDFTTLIDRKQTLFKRFAIHFIPTVFVINRQGTIVRRIVGWQGSQELQAALKAGEQ